MAKFLFLALTSTALLAQTVTIELVPALRGDVSVRIYSELPRIPLGLIRQAMLSCDWRVTEDSAGFLEGVCRKYLTSDGGSARGSVAVAPILVALHSAGAKTVTVNLNDYGNPFAEPPKGWTPIIHAPKTPFGSLKSTEYRFISRTNSELPLPVEIRIGTPWSAARLAIPFAVTLLAPAFLAIYLRRRAGRKGAENPVVWVHWLLTTIWLNWISAVSTSDIAAFGAHLGLGMAAAFVIGSAMFSVPPLAATASCMAILLRRASEPEDDPWGLIKRAVAREATILVPFGMVLVGAGMFNQDWQISMASLPVAYFTYRLLTWLVGRWSSSRAEVLSRGELFETASVIARRAGVALGSIYIIGNRSAREANAFAARGRILAMTRGLVEHLTRRELVAVMGHEMAHMRGKHVATRMLAFWGYILVIGPVVAHYAESGHLPAWILTLPVLPVIYIFATAFLSRNHEFAADAGAVDLVRDPEGMIAALARLRQMSRSPVDWGGIQGSILSHPSMRDRVLAIARRFQLPEDRALALLINPDLLAVGTPSDQLHYPLPDECAGIRLVFSSAAKSAYIMWARWIEYAALAAITLAAGIAALNFGPRRYVLLKMVAGVPVAAALFVEFGRLLERCFVWYLRRKLAGRMGPAAAAGAFAGFLPGRRVSPAEGFYFWDAGFLFLSPDYLTYRGERATFSLPRGPVVKISVEKGPLAWRRTYGVTIGCVEGAMTFLTPDRGASRRQARQLERRLVVWWKGEPIERAVDIPAAPAPARELFGARANYLRGWRAVRVLGLRAVMLSIGLVVFMPYLLRWTPAVAFVPFTAPLAYLLAVCPYFFRRKPEAEKATDSTAAPLGAGN